MSMIKGKIIAWDIDDVLVEIKADFVVDDQLKHCTAAVEQGIPTILFGNYRWNQAEELPKGVTRCKNWQEVAGYFDAAR